MKILVTGGAGFIGSHVVDAAAVEGADVLALDSLDPRLHHSAPEYLRDDVDYCFSDLRYLDPDSRFEDVEAIVHLAALGGVGRASREPENIIDANCRGTARLLKYARKWPRLKRIVLAGSFSIYGSNYTYTCSQCGTRTDGSREESNLAAQRYEVYCPDCGADAEIVPIREDAPPAPLETYAASKYMQELCFRGFDHCPVSILRFSSVYGPRLRLYDGEATIIAQMAGWVRSGQRPRLFEDGLQMRDWVYVGDVVAAILELLNGAQAPPVMNVCSGVGIRLSEACKAIASAYGVECDPEVVGGFRAGDMRHCLGDPGLFRNLIGRDPVSFSEGSSLAFGPDSQQGSETCAAFSLLTV